MIRKRRRTDARPDVVASVEEQTCQAASLARIAGQARLMDPRTNPAVRAHADRLRDDQQRRALEAEHARVLRRHRVADRRAEAAERTLEVIRAAQQMSSPARSVLALHQGRRRFLGVSMAASLALSVGSAMGVADLAAQHGTDRIVGYLAEVGLTGLSTMAILYRSHLGVHGTPIERGSRQSRVLWLLTVVPLLAGITANALAHGAVGVFCAVGAAAFATLAHLISDQSGAALRSRAGEVTDVDVAELEATAMGDDLFTVVDAEPEPTAPGPERLLTKAEMQAEVLEDLIAALTVGTEPGESSPDAEPPARPELFSDEALAAWIDGGDPPAGEVTSAPPAPDADGPQGAAKALPTSPEASMRTRVHIDGDQRDGGASVPPGVESAVAARRAQGEQTRARVAAYMDAHPGATAAEIAAALDLSKDTVKRHRRDIRRQIRQEGE